MGLVTWMQPPTSAPVLPTTPKTKPEMLATLQVESYCIPQFSLEVILDVTKMNEQAYTYIGCYLTHVQADAETFLHCSKATSSHKSSHQPHPTQMDTTLVYKLQE